MPNLNDTEATEVFEDSVRETDTPPQTLAEESGSESVSLRRGSVHSDSVVVIHSTQEGLDSLGQDHPSNRSSAPPARAANGSARGAEPREESDNSSSSSALLDTPHTSSPRQH